MFSTMKRYLGTTSDEESRWSRWSWDGYKLFGYGLATAENVILSAAVVNDSETMQGLTFAFASAAIVVLILPEIKTYYGAAKAYFSARNTKHLHSDWKGKALAAVPVVGLGTITIALYSSYAATFFEETEPSTSILLGLATGLMPYGMMLGTSVLKYLERELRGETDPSVITLTDKSKDIEIERTPLEQLKLFKQAFSFSYQSLQQMTDELERKCKVLQLRYEKQDEHSFSLRSPKEEASTSDSEFERKQHKQAPYQGSVETLKESERLVKRVRNMQRDMKTFFDGLEQLSTVTEEEWLMLEKLMCLGEEVIKMNVAVQPLLASTIEPIPEKQTNLNLPLSLHLEKGEKDEKDTQGSERHMEEKELFKTPVVHKREHRRSSSSSVSVEPSEKYSQEETSSENSRSPHSNSGSKHE